MYLSGLRSLHTDLGYGDPTAGRIRLERVFRGVKRLQGTKDSKPRLPITTALLALFRPLLDMSVPDDRLSWAAMTLATCGLFRVGEITVPKSSTPDPYGLLTISNLKFSNPMAPSQSEYMTIHLKASKADPFRKEIDVHVANPSAIDAMVSYLAQRPAPISPSSPLLAFSDGKPLDRFHLINATRSLVSQLGLDASLYSGHSFRRGGATSLALAGVPDRIIKIMGRWRGWSYGLYIDVPIGELIRAGLRM